MHLGPRVPVDSARDLLQRLLDGSPEALLHHLVDARNVALPLALNVLNIVLKRLVTVSHQRLDLLVRMLQPLLNLAPVLLLRMLEAPLLVDALVLNLDQQGVADDAAQPDDLLVVLLEVCHQLVKVLGMRAAGAAVVVHDAPRRPLELVDAGVDLGLEVLQLLLEQPPLPFVAECVENLVEVSHHKHHILADHAELLALGGHLHGIVGDGEHELLPVANLLKEAEEILVKVHLEVSPSDLDQQILLELCRVVLINRQRPVLVVFLDILVHRRRVSVHLRLRVLVLSAALEVVGAVQQVHLVLKALLQPLCPQGGPGVLWELGADGGVLAVGIELLEDIVELIAKDAIHVRRLLLDSALDRLALGQVVEGLEHLEALVGRDDRLKGRGDDVLHHNLEILDAVFEDVVVIVPLGGLDVENVVLERRDVVHDLAEALFDRPEVLGDLLTLHSAKDGNVLGSRVAELVLALADLEKVPAALHEGVDLREDAALIKVPAVGGRDNLHPPHSRPVHLLPVITRLDALPQNHGWLVDPAGENVLQGDVLAAPQDDLVGNLAEQPGDALLGVVVLAERPDHTHKVEHLREVLRDVLGLGHGELGAGVREALQEGEVVLRLHRALEDLVSKVIEGLEVATLGKLQHSHNRLDVLPLKLRGDAGEVQ
mmetsp:Transcript_27988/g.68419  ORF Transcript_27988/g.68419 Transcript_27988/m.68419 type:complete len:657 (-) Transcript_27988:774-2744(-)